MVALSKRTWLGVGVETTPGTALTAPTVYHPCKSIMKGTKKREQIKDERGSRDDVYGIVDTVREGTTDPKGFWYNDTSPYFLLAAFGAVTTTTPDSVNAPTARHHAFALADIPKNLTLFKSYDSNLYVGSYTAVEKWTLKYSSDGKLLENDVSVKHLYPVKYTGAALTPTFSTAQPFAGYAPKLTVGGTQTLDIDDVTIEFDQKLTMWYPSGGTQDFVTIYYGARNVKVDFTARFDTDTLYQHYLASPRIDDSFVLDVQGALIGGTTTQYYQELNINIPIISYDSMDHDTSKDNVLIKAKATGVSGTSGLISAYVVNTVTGYAS